MVANRDCAKRVKAYDIATKVASFGSGSRKDPTGTVNVPIFQTATFDCREQSQYDYTRSGNPTRHALEELCGSLEGTDARSFAFTSGMAALTAVTRLVKPGDTILACQDIYGGMHRLLMNCAKISGIKINFVETWELDQVEKAFAEEGHRIKLVCLESPTNPQMRVSDIQAISRIARAHDAIVCVDNSIMSPLLMQPLTLGADIVVHSATKFMSGHSDVMAGIVTCKNKELADRIAFVQNAEGSGLAPFDSWLVLRGLKTMALRVAAAQKNALLVYEFLIRHPDVVAVNYLKPLHEEYLQIDAALEEQKRSVANPNWRQETHTHFEQATGGGALLSFEMRDATTSQALIQNLALFKNTVSFGSCSSLAEIPAEMSHASIPAEMQTMSPALVRLSIGIEDSDDLIADLSSAIAAATCSNGYKLQRTASYGSFPLGQSLPPKDYHAVGVSMPSWDDVVRYEEGDPNVHAQLSAGYPRFVFLHAVKQLFAKAEELFAHPNERAMVLPSARIALRFQAFLGSKQVDLHDCFAHGAFAATFPEELMPQAKKFWQHSGEIISSRQAAAVLDVIDRTCFENARTRGKREVRKAQTLDKAEAPDARMPPAAPHSAKQADYSSREALLKRIGSIMHENPRNVYLFPTGMAAIASTQRLLKLSSQWEEKPLRTVVFGFPYLDTLKLAQLESSLGSGCTFFGRGDEADFQDLRKLLETERISGLFCEFPSNPLLMAPDLARLRSLADEFGFALIVDDSVVGSSNVDLTGPGGADIICTSLTKQFSGSGNVMGGSLVLNSEGPLYSVLKSRIDHDHEENLWYEDAQVLLKACADLEARVAQTNATTMTLIDHLSKSPHVKKIYHPSCVGTELYDRYKRDVPHAGYGSLFSVVFKNPQHAQRFYNKLQIPKSPGFGTNFSMTCPYTVIAHYNELEWAAEFGVDESLIRIWIGMEDARELVAKFDAALDSC
ncbi:Cystathionine gamma-lyase [Hondaea fermentalgiana]|uniref:Cystathionine gamma-lyase n=1 Tax=Hondaea fermentalgiana TaxID=2315210 RepID=A0A2R5GI33_9STRA|nr:Cystathionine gamma-lyase [Hondaea fermentalgiana]|eukprot:GBG29388.1 Cystathionine gamma-lyase [Hondaea fermentalgiana]